MAITNGFEDLSTEATLAQVRDRLPNAVPDTLPASTDDYLPVRQLPAKTWRTGFSKSIASPGVDTARLNLVAVGSGGTVAQSGGSLVIGAGTTGRAETIVRSNESFRGDLNVRYFLQLSQRIANNNFYVELVDVLGDNLAYTINSATSVTVTLPGNTTLDSTSVGQSVYLGAVTGAAGIPGRYAIAAVAGDQITFTVASWPSTGTGTLSLFGYNYQHVYYSGTTVTAATFDMQRNGWATGESSATINTTATGHVGIFGSAKGTGVFFDQTGASSTALETSQRVSRVRNIPDDETVLYFQVRSQNAASAPASNTTLTMGFVEVDNFVTTSVSIANIAPQSANVGLPTSVVNVPSVAQSGTWNIGTVTSATVTPVAGTPLLVTTAASTNATSTKTSAGTLFEISASNPTATAAYLKFYNKASAPTVGTDVPILIITVPANTTAFATFGEVGKRFSTGIALAVTGAMATTDTTATVAGIIVSGTYL